MNLILVEKSKIIIEVVKRTEFCLVESSGICVCDCEVI